MSLLLVHLLLHVTVFNQELPACCGVALFFWATTTNRYAFPVRSRPNNVTRYTRSYSLLAQVLDTKIEDFAEFGKRLEKVRRLDTRVASIYALLCHKCVIICILKRSVYVLCRYDGRTWASGYVW